MKLRVLPMTSSYRFKRGQAFDGCSFASTAKSVGFKES